MKRFLIEISGEVTKGDISDALYQGLERNEVDWTSYNVLEVENEGASQ
ncbi:MULTISPECIES: hypothetical protein [Bacillus cereus group]|uniref:Uncharacterized protein n=1 Tax=Bacillus cereus VD196 TaxID=1053243 RepID=A0A9W5Q525_BACCE|nr:MULTISPECIES: hypothetical protein [Bacillus cereus group]EKS8371771.1 hypothetical protein [Bacillus cereus]EOO67470.1 hypothetical protein IKE_02597 [Bacillus cereus VD196]MCQ6305048.1 hypothetical protein [Bacillus cereus]MCQ6339520.1 hypothetical protein [Bacillus cereus]MCU4813963.1 hypothetical protein [Bacillus cereus]